VIHHGPRCAHPRAGTLFAPDHSPETACFCMTSVITDRPLQNAVVEDCVLRKKSCMTPGAARGHKSRLLRHRSDWRRFFASGSSMRAAARAMRGKILHAAPGKTRRTQPEPLQDMEALARCSYKMQARRIWNAKYLRKRGFALAKNELFAYNFCTSSNAGFPTAARD
jgi:hypothetical protein